MDGFDVSKILDMQTYFEERMARFEAELQKKPQQGSGSLADDFAMFKAFVLQSLKTFSQQLEVVGHEVDKLEMRSRRKILLLHGIEECKDEVKTQVVVETVKQRLKMDTFSSDDIRRCQRMGRQTSSGKARPILIKFQSLVVRDNMWFTKTKLKETGITLSEFLTRSRHNAFMAARAKFGVAKCWTREGYIYILGPDGNRHRITSVGDLGSIKLAVKEKPAAKPQVAPKTKRAATAKK